MKYLFSLLFIFLLFNSCSKELKDFPDLGRRIVINALLTTDSVASVRVSRSYFINDISGHSGTNPFYDLDSADVEIRQSNIKVDSLYHKNFDAFYLYKVFNSGNYRTKNLIPQTGIQYEIIARHVNLPDASASIIIPKEVKIIKVDTSRITFPQGTYINTNAGYKCDIEFNDPADEKNYYILDVRELAGIDYPVPDNNLDFSCIDPIVEEKLFSGYYNEGISFSDRLINGQKHILSIRIRKELIGNYTDSDTQIVCFRLYSITEDYFRYIHDLNLYSKNFGNPLADPVLLNSNVSGGYGMVSGAAVSSYSIIFKKNYGNQ
jgi:hypothetical protein